MRRSIPTLAALLLLACGQQRLRNLPPPGSRVDTWNQISISRLDVLWVVDNASNIAPYQKELAQSFHTFLAYLDQNQIDYQLGVTTTDVNATHGQLQGNPSVIVSSDPNRAAEFAKTVVALGDQGSPFEAGLAAADEALRHPPPGFLRPGASLFIAFLTDDDDPWSFGTTRYYLRTFKYAKGPGNDGLVKVSAIAGDPPSGCSVGDFHADPAFRYQQVVTSMGGIFGSICQASFDQVFAQMGAAAVGLKRKFPLSQIPSDPTQISVHVDYPCGTPVSQLQGCASADAFCSGDPHQIDCTVRPDGQNGWSYESSTNSLVFNGDALPPKGAAITATYVEKGAVP